jgi:L-serine/L-threonine ammonia-lyase
MENLKARYLQTPLFQSPELNNRLGKEIWFKMESHQPTRSFKLRGMSYLVNHHFARGNKRFVASSGGNAGYSLAYACRQVGARTHVVVPSTTPLRMRTMIAGEGATVEVHGNAWPEAHIHAMEVAESQNAIYVSPFDDPLLWKGHSTMIDECAEVIAEPDMVIAAVGGGGLLCGLMEGMERNGWKNSTFLGAETSGAASLAKVIKEGEWGAIASIDTIATSLGARQVAEKAFQWTQDRSVASYVCSDKQAVAATKGFLDHFNVLVEPACGAALSAVYLPAPEIQSAKSILVIACGGAGIYSDTFLKYLQDFGLVEMRPSATD